MKGHPLLHVGVEALKPGLALPQKPLDLHPLGDVETHTDRRLKTPLLVSKVGGVPENLPGRPSLPEGRNIDALPPLSCLGFQNQGCIPLHLRVREEALHLPPHNLPSLQAHQFLEGSVHMGDPEVWVPNKDGAFRVLEEVFQKLSGLPKFTLGLALFGDHPSLLKVLKG